LSVTKRRINSLLVDKGLVESRAKAQALIMAGEVVVDGKAAPAMIIVAAVCHLLLIVRYT